MWIAYSLVLAAALYFGPGGGLSRFLADEQEQHQQVYAESVAQVAVNMLHAGVAHQRQHTGFDGPLDPVSPSIPTWLRSRAGDVGVLLISAGKPASGVYVFGIRNEPGVHGHIDRMAHDDVVIASYGGAKHRGSRNLPYPLPDALNAYFRKHSGKSGISSLILFIAHQ